MFGNWPKITLGYVSGIPIRLDFTFVIVPLLFLNRFSAQAGNELWFEIGAVIVGVFLSVLLHELGHALSARSFGIGVAEVVVGGFYGYARMLPHRTTRRRSVAVLAAGPGANLLIFLALWAFLSFPSIGELRTIAFVGYPQTVEPVWLAKALGLLTLINLAMFVFNLLPAFPLDGGRIVDQVLSYVMTPQKGVRVSAILGVIVGAVIAYFGMGLGIFLALIGVFILIVNLGRLRGRRPQQPPPRNPSIHQK